MKPENMRNEGHVKKAVRELAEFVGAYHVMSVPVGYGKQGIPDFLLCVRGRLVGVETKFRTNRVSAHQVRELKAIHQAGGISVVANEKGLVRLGLLLDKVAKTPWAINPEHVLNFTFARRGEPVQHDGLPWGYVWWENDDGQ